MQCIQIRTLHISEVEYLMNTEKWCVMFEANCKCNETVSEIALG
jgi:hypothetical protein